MPRLSPRCYTRSSTRARGTRKINVEGHKEMTLASALGELDEALVEASVERLLAEGMRPRAIQEMLEQGILLVAENYCRGEYFLADRLYASRIYRRIMELPRMSSAAPGAAPLGTVLVGPLPGDSLDEGNDALAASLRACGFRAVDLGLRASAADFEAAIGELHPDVLILSFSRADEIASLASFMPRLRSAPPGVPALVLRGCAALARDAAALGADAYAGDVLAAADFCLARMGGSAR